MTVKEEIEHARRFGEHLENLVVDRGQFRLESDRSIFIVGYWSLLFDYHKCVLALLANELYGGAFALVRPVVEGLLRAHVVQSGSDEELEQIRRDEYFVNFKKIGAQIDQAFGFEGFFDNLLKHARTSLHSYTHSGALQLARRFDGKDVYPHYPDAEILDVINGTTIAVFLMTVLTTKHFGLEPEWNKTNALFSEYGKRPPE